MAETCEVVALGRDDVCLEFKKVLTAYDTLQLDKALSGLNEDLEFVKDGKKAVLTELVGFISMINKNAFDDLAASASALDLSPLQGSDEKAYKLITTDLTSVVANAKRREASPIARAVIKLVADVRKVV